MCAVRFNQFTRCAGPQRGALACMRRCNAQRPFGDIFAAAAAAKGSRLLASLAATQAVVCSRTHATTPCATAATLESSPCGRRPALVHPPLPPHMASCASTQKHFIPTGSQAWRRRAVSCTRQRPWSLPAPCRPIRAMHCIHPHDTDDTLAGRQPKIKVFPSLAGRTNHRPGPRLRVPLVKRSPREGRLYLASGPAQQTPHPLISLAAQPWHGWLSLGSTQRPSLPWLGRPAGIFCQFQT